MNKKIDLLGKRFGRLIVTKEAGRSKWGRTIWECKCDCCNEIVVSGLDLRRGHTKSCGCIRRKHGLRNHPLYTVWQNLRCRCQNINDVGYHDYGARGINVCKEWRDSPELFISWAAANGWQKGFQIDRKDNNKGYSPGNCRFTTSSNNMLNTRLLNRKNTSGLRGVDWHKRSAKYRARVKINNKVYSLGYFESAVEAGKARDAFVVERGLHTPLNFPNGHRGG